MFSMFGKMICLVSFVLVLSLVGDVQAVNVTWTDDGPDHLWSTATNWDTGTVPTAFENAFLDMLPGPTIVNEGAVADKIFNGRSKTGELTVDGGTLTTSKWLAIGHSAGIEGTLNMKSGTITIGNVLYVGYHGSGTLNMTGGTLVVPGTMVIPQIATATGHVNLDGGTITANNFNMRRQDGSDGTIDVRVGTLILNGDKLSQVQGYIDNGWITAYGGNGGILHLDYDVTNEGKTTLKATHMLNPNPADGGLASPGEVELSWTLPDPCVSGQPVLVDVYFTDDLQLLKQFTEPAAIQVVSKQNVTSVIVQTQLKTQYYWAVDTYVGDPNDPILGPIFSFFADNQAPKVDAGDDVATWLDNGLRVVQLDGAVSDEDGGPGPATLLWTVIAEPNELNPAQISDPLAANPTVTVIELGSYTLQLEAGDGEFTVTDTMQIALYADSCECAQNQEGFEWIPGDINQDCIVNELDIVMLIEHWLEENFGIE